MQDINEIVKKLTPLVKSYARDMKILLVDDTEEFLELYKASFGKYFSVCDTANDGQEALEMWNSDREYYDLIVTDVQMPRLNGLELVKEIRKNSMQQSLIVITAMTDIDMNQDLAYFYIDGLLPKPIDRKKLFVLLYRVLKKIDDKKELDFYIQDLENQAIEAQDYKNHYNYIITKLKPVSEQKEIKEVIAMLKTLVHKENDIIAETNNAQESKTKISEDNKKDIRFSVIDKLTAIDFCESLDDTVVDKIEDFQERLDSYVSTIYDVENANPINAKANLNKINEYLSEFVYLVDSLTAFPIIARSFNSLMQFLHDISIESLSNNENKALLIQMLLGIEQDLKVWIETIFIKKETKDINYLDASFSNNIFEIESIFNDTVIETDEDDLEFF